MTHTHTPEQLAAWEQELSARYRQYQDARLSLDLTRGKPSTAQVALSNPLANIIGDDFILPDGTDIRNYGGLDGILPARELGAAILEVPVSHVMASDHTSLGLMYHYMLHAYLHGVRGKDSAWQREKAVKFLAVVPGYDRHFAICEEFGIELVNVPMAADGPDMDQVEALVAADPSIKGIWCVPKYSNPTGQVYSDATVARLAALAKIAGPHFRIFWDNAYVVHDLDDQPPRLANLLTLAEEQGTADSVVVFTSTAKVTFAGGGVSFIASSLDNLTWFRKHLGVVTIGPNKLNQWAHVKFLRDRQGVREHMRRQAALIAPKFDAVDQHLQEGLTGKGMGEWTRPRGGYFVSFDSLPGLAKEIIRLTGDAGVKLTPAGATFPYGQDPEDRNIRLAPTFPSLEDVDRAMAVFVTCVQLATVRHWLKAAG